MYTSSNPVTSPFFITIALFMFVTSPAFLQRAFWLHGSFGVAVTDNYGADSQSIAAYLRNGTLTYSVRLVNSERERGLITWSWNVRCDGVCTDSCDPKNRPLQCSLETAKQRFTNTEVPVPGTSQLAECPQKRYI